MSLEALNIQNQCESADFNPARAMNSVDKLFFPERDQTVLSLGGAALSTEREPFWEDGVEPSWFCFTD